MYALPETLEIYNTVYICRTYLKNQQRISFLRNTTVWSDQLVIVLAISLVNQIFEQGSFAKVQVAIVDQIIKQGVSSIIQDQENIICLV